MTKRFSINKGSIIGLSSIYTDNGKVMTQLEVLDVLIKQHETIQTLTKENEQLKKQIERIDFILDDLNGAEYISRDDGIKALNKIDKVIGKRGCVND